jgi:hypothetical protein
MGSKSRKVKNKNNKSKKNNNNSNFNTVSFYAKKFKDTSLIPWTHIISYMKNNFNDYLKLYDKTEKENKFFIYLDDCFNFGKKIKSGQRVLSFDSPIDGKTSMSLDKLIAYSFYMKTKIAFIDVNNEITSNAFYLKTLKYQMGKDIRRDNRVINGKEYSSSLYNDKDNLHTADLFYQTLIDYFYKIDNNINYDIINKIALLSCQNIFNLLTDMITIKLNNILSPETNSVFRPEKNIIITINDNEKKMELIFDTQLVISKDGNPMDPEYPCGKLVFHFLIDFNKNIYKFSKFELSYDINKCGPEEINNNTDNFNTDNNNNNNNSNDNSNSSNKLIYALPIAAGIGGIIATPFILGSLGGKQKYKNYRKYKKCKKNKTIKKKK